MDPIVIPMWDVSLLMIVRVNCSCSSSQIVEVLVNLVIAALANTGHICTAPKRAPHHIAYNWMSGRPTLALQSSWDPHVGFSRHQ